MEYGHSALEYEAHRRQVAERGTRTTTPRIPSTTHRHLLTRSLLRFADRPES